jgi:hypothetical protein
VSLWGRVYRERRAVVLPLLVLGLANVAVLAAGVFPLSRHVASLEQGAVDADLALKFARADDLKARGERESKIRTEADLERFHADVLPEDFSSAAELTDYFLAKAAQESRLTFHSGQFRPVPPTDDRKTRLTKMTSKVTLKGDYQSMRRFLYRVETAEEFVIVEGVHLAQPGASDTGRELELDLNVATYFLPRTPGAGAK